MTIKDTIKSLVELVKMPIEQRYNVILLSIVIALGFIIRHQYLDIQRRRIDYAEEKYRMQKAATEERQELQREIDNIKDRHLEYLQKMDQEYRELLKVLYNKVE